MTEGLWSDKLRSKSSNCLWKPIFLGFLTRKSLARSNSHPKNKDQNNPWSPQPQFSNATCSLSTYENYSPAFQTKSKWIRFLPGQHTPSYCSPPTLQTIERQIHKAPYGLHTRQCHIQIAAFLLHEICYNKGCTPVPKKNRKWDFGCWNNKSQATMTSWLRVSLYKKLLALIRNEDLVAWQLVGNRSMWTSNRLDLEPQNDCVTFQVCTHCCVKCPEQKQRDYWTYLQNMFLPSCPNHPVNPPVLAFKTMN